MRKFMKTFLLWAKENKLALPTIEGEGEKANSSENTKRSAISNNYPDACVRGQYPRKYFNPITSTADGKLDGKMGS